MGLPRTDADIKRDVIESLYWDTRVDAADIGVLVDDGRVTLIGTVPTYRARAAARDDALVIHDVRGVENRLEVEISAQLDTPTDKELQATVEEVLAADPDLAATHIDVAVRDGSVRLTGSVPTYWERELARSVVGALPGVRGLANEVVVVPTGQHDDRQIAQAVVAMLKRNRHVDLSAIDVEVVDGVVTLSGPVPHESVREEVLDAARHTHGVTDITDLLQISGGR